MRLWPGSLFGRLALLLVGVLAIAIATTILLFRQDRAALLLRHFGDTRIVQLEGLRNALESLPVEGRREALAQLARRNGVRLFPADERDPGGFTSRGFRAGKGRWRDDGPRMRGTPSDSAMGERLQRERIGERSDRDDPLSRDADSTSDAPPGALAPFLPVLAQLEVRLEEAFGPTAEVRVSPRAQVLWVRLPTGTSAYWVGLPLPPRPQAGAEPSRAIAISLALAGALLAAAFVFARYLARPLRELEAAVARVGRGETQQPLPESGPSEIASVNRGFNTMLANLRQIERDRAVLLAGVSHDLRTPLARLRLGIELSQADAATREGMVADIAEMDRVIGQFLDFARGEDGIPIDPVDLDQLIRDLVKRYDQAGREVRFHAGGASAWPVRSTAMTRLVSNLIDNALAYGASPVEVSTTVDEHEVTVEVADRGRGIAPADVARLKQPFTRADDARAREDGAPGAGLGLAIVDRIARLHGGAFDLLPREGGGTLARVRLPRPAKP